MSEITSLQNPRVKEIVKLRDRRARDQTGCFLIEGYRELLRASEGEQKLHALYICPKLFLGSNEDGLIDRLDAPVFECTEEVFRKISYRDRPDGLLAVAPRLDLSLSKLPEVENPLYIVAEAIEKPGNLGTILRSADATGVDGVIVSDRQTDVTNPNVVRASVGTLFTLPIAETTNEEALKWLKEKGVQIVAATPDATTLYTDADLQGPLAIAVGTEQLGLTDFWMEQADIQIRLPMKGHADSLNVATATTVLLYEALRQRT